MNATKKILITFDVEEFDLPLEYNKHIPINEQLRVGKEGVEAIADILSTPHVTATLFTTAFFAQNNIECIKALAEKHEIGSHSLSHTSFNESDIKLSREKLEEITGKTIHGFRMPRMQKIDPAVIWNAGYSYNSSINPTWLPGRYNNLHTPRRPFMEGSLIQCPVSVTPYLRIPLFWLAFKNMPYKLYLRMVLQALAYDGYVCLYFHPWEFINISGYQLPFFIKKGSKGKLLMKMKKLINDLSEEGEFMTMNQYVKEKILLNNNSIIQKLL